MKITYRTLGKLISRMNDDQLDSDVTVEIREGSTECYPAELRIAAEDHDGGLDDGHPVLFTLIGKASECDRRDDVDAIATEIGLDSSSAICGLCGQPGADKVPHPHRWPGEAKPDSELVHAECEQAECARAHARLTPDERRNFLRSTFP